MPEILGIAVPCFNEQEVLPSAYKLFTGELEELVRRGKIAEESFVLFINDGSRDRTWDLIREYAAKDSRVKGISLSRNRGHQNALFAGLMEAKEMADVVISIDCDGQDDVTVMEKMIDAYHAGNDIVYGVRTDRSTDSFFKRGTAQLFYRLLNAMGAETVYNHADCRLASVRVLNELAGFREVNLFLRGLFPLVGFQSTEVGYERNERIAGETHYPLSKMLSLAFNGITSLSVRPLQLITGMGFVIAFLSLIAIVYVFIRKISGNTVSGWASLACIVCFLGGLQILSIGVVGEYIGKIYLETKQRPRYIINEKTF